MFPQLKGGETLGVFSLFAFYTFSPAGARV